MGGLARMKKQAKVHQAFERTSANMEAVNDLGHTTAHQSAGFSPLMTAALYGDTAVVSNATPADLVVVDADGRTALMVAASAGHLDFCRELMKRGTPCDIKSHNKWTALFFASAAGHTDVVEMLLLTDTPNVRVHHLAERDLAGLTALDVARAGRDNFEANGRRRSLLKLFSSSSHTSTIELLQAATAPDWPAKTSGTTISGTISSIRRRASLVGSSAQRRMSRGAPPPRANTPTALFQES